MCHLHSGFWGKTSSGTEKQLRPDVFVDRTCRVERYQNFILAFDCACSTCNTSAIAQNIRSGQVSKSRLDFGVRSLEPMPSSRCRISRFFICLGVGARFLHGFCTVSKRAEGAFRCKIRQRVQKLLGEKSRCFD